ncbi:MAG: hypothetical protein RLZZ15_421 [Verrucomicrobiota bacterium]
MLRDRFRIGARKQHLHNLRDITVVFDACTRATRDSYRISDIMQNLVHTIVHASVDVCCVVSHLSLPKDQRSATPRSRTLRSTKRGAPARCAMVLWSGILFLCLSCDALNALFAFDPLHHLHRGIEGLFRRFFSARLQIVVLSDLKRGEVGVVL